MFTNQRFHPSLDEVKQLSSKYNVIPVCLEVYADMETPISLFKRFCDDKYAFLLESVEGGEKWARFSFIGFNPYMTVHSKSGITTIERKGETTVCAGNPVHVLRDIMKAHIGADLPEIPRFNGGAVGFFGYDTIRYFEKLPDNNPDMLNIPESHFMFTDEVLVYDHFKQKILIIVNIHTDAGVNLERSYAGVLERIRSIYRDITHHYVKRLQEAHPKKNKQNVGEVEFVSNMSFDEYCNAVVKAKQYIKDGDIFQVVLSQRLSAKTDADPLDVYRALRIINPSPYMYFLRFNDYTLVGSSPEMLTRVENGTVETCPIAGTRPRGKTDEEDRQNERELLKDPKELAEHTMLVDLGRNDVGRVCKFGTVEVTRPMHIERYSHVMHIVTNVKGEKREDKSPFDALMSILPAGTVSGAPKVRAMEIIDELENVRRGAYAGAIGYLSYNGNLDSCITIRTMIFKEGYAHVQAGGGIVHDSIPENEYQESMNKAGALLAAIKEAAEIL